MTNEIARRVASPAAFVFVTIILRHFIVVDEGSLDVGGGRLGPGAWPEAMLIGIVVCAVLWAARELVPLLTRRPNRTPPTVVTPAEEYDHGRALVGVAVVLIYGLAIPYLGFMAATLVFLAVWMWLGGMRAPIAIPTISVLGTIALLYVFALLARMPLDRGAGVMDDVTVAVYRLLKIF